MTAGNPVYAPIPMRKLLDVQPCTETEPYQPATAKPFWKDFRDMVWARAAGEMQVLYYYPLQRSFPLPHLFSFPPPHLFSFLSFAFTLDLLKLRSLDS